LGLADHGRQLDDGAVYCEKALLMGTGNHIRNLRDAKSWTQADLAERLGVSRQTVIAIERGRYDPSLPLAFSIARVFELRIDDVFFPIEAEEGSNQG
jgi:putative transcriptional regulator